jgi:hypothetical protein
VVVSPLHALGNDAAIAHGISQVGGGLVHLVGGAELKLVKRGAVTNHNLTRVLVGHHDGGHGQLGALSSGVVSVERLFDHANVVVFALFEGRTEK